MQQEAQWRAPLRPTDDPLRNGLWPGVSLHLAPFLGPSLAPTRGRVRVVPWRSAVALSRHGWRTVDLPSRVRLRRPADQLNHGRVVRGHPTSDELRVRKLRLPVEVGRGAEIDGAGLSRARGISRAARAHFENSPPYFRIVVRLWQQLRIDTEGTCLTRANDHCCFRAPAAQLQDASTLTMQLARNLSLTPRRTIARKVEETALALFLEAVAER